MPHTARYKARRRRRLLIVGGAALLLLTLLLLLILRPFQREAPAAAQGPAGLAASDGRQTLSAASDGRQPLSAASDGARVPGGTPAPAVESDGGAGEAAAEPAAARTLERSLYEAVLVCDPAAGAVTAQLRLTYHNAGADTLYQLVLRLWPNAMVPGSLRIESVSMEGKEVYYTLTEGDSVLSIPFTRELAPGADAAVYLRYTLSVPAQRGRLGRSRNGLLLGNAMPVAATLENGAWRIDGYVQTGDSFVSDVADYKVVIRCPKTYTVAATGSLHEARLDDEGMYEAYYLAPQVRDFAAALTQKCFTAVSSSGNGVTVYGYAGFKDRAQYLADTAAGALSYFESKIGPYPYAELSAVGGELDGGMEYPGLIMVDGESLAGSRRTSGELYIAHEVAHQWFYGLLGTDQVREPWVDEALVEFLGFAYIRAAHGEEYAAGLAQTFFGSMEKTPPVLPLNAPLAAFAAAENPNEYFYGVYGRGYQLYSELCGVMGEARFYAALESLYAQRLFQRVDGAALMDAFSRAAGEDMTPYFQAYMAGAGRE